MVIDNKQKLKRIPRKSIVLVNSLNLINEISYMAFSRVTVSLSVMMSPLAIEEVILPFNMLLFLYM